MKMAPLSLSHLPDMHAHYLGRFFGLRVCLETEDNIIIASFLQNLYTDVYLVCGYVETKNSCVATSVLINLCAVAFEPEEAL